MKTRALLLAAFLPTAAFCLQVELRNLDGTPAQGVGFGALTRERVHRAAGQYLFIQYPPSDTRRVYIYTDNRLLVSAPLGGLVSIATRQEVMPLFWLDTPLPQAGTPVFSEGTESAWKRLIDRENPDFPFQPALRTLTSFPQGESAVHLGVITSSSAPGGTYRARLVVEEVSDLPDVQPPLINHEPFGQLIFTGAPVTFQAAVQDDYQVSSATFHYRFQGQLAYQDLPMTLVRDPANPFRWLAQVSIPIPPEQVGGVDYFFSASDGFNDSTTGGRPRESGFFVASLLSSDEPVCRAIPLAGGRLPVYVGDPALGASSLDFRPRSLPANTTVCVRYLDPRSLPDWRGQRPVAAFDFSPEGQRFRTPVDVSLVYPDADRDGRVDGDDRQATGLRLFWFDGRVWRHVGGRVDAANRRVTVSLSHFSVYGLMAAPALSEEMVRPAEKIFTPNDDGVNDYLQFNLSGPCEITIFDESGRRVRRLSNVSAWDGRGDDGRAAEIGVYVYKVEAAGLTVTGTVGLAR